MPPFRHPRRRAMFVLALALMAMLPASPAFAAPASSTAVSAALAQGTPVIVPPVKRKRLRCTINKRTKRCTKLVTTKCTTSKGIKTCKRTLLSCRAPGRIKRCVTKKLTCKSSAKRRTKCKTTSRKTTVFPVLAGAASGAIPRFTLQPARSAHDGTPAIASRLVSSDGALAAPPPLAEASDASPRRLGTGIGAVVLVAALICMVLGRRRPRTGV